MNGFGRGHWWSAPLVGGKGGRCVVGTLVCLGLLLEKEEKEREGGMRDIGECLYVEYVL